MTITTNRGKTFDIRFIHIPLRDAGRVMIEYADERALADIAADFDGLETITKTDDIRPGAKEVFEGFSHLVGIQRNTAAGTVRLTLERGADND